MFHYLKNPIQEAFIQDAELVNCPLCSSARYSPWMRAAAKNDMNLLFEIVSCDACGFKFTNPRPTMQNIGGYYGDDYYSYQLPIDRVSAKLFSTKNKARFLDYGCGAGHKLIEKMNQGYEAYGVELDDKARQIGRTLGLDIRPAKMDRIDFVDDYFDEIHINNVLEHLHRPTAIIAEAFRCLKRGGRLWIEVPNIESFDSKLFGDMWRHLDVPLHLNHFGPQSLRFLLHKYDFKHYVMKTHHVPVFDPNLYYLKGLYTTMKIKFETETGSPISRYLASRWFVVSRLLKYFVHRKNENDGNMLQVIAAK
jgi:SAM-dependent methyltransferase